MILPALVALQVALGPLLRGSWDLWAQTFIHAATLIGVGAWLLSRTAVGYLPLPSRRNLAWTAALVFLSALSAWRSPVHSLALAEWYNFLNALWLFPFLAAISKDERLGIDVAVRAAGWVLMVLAFYQHFWLDDARPASALVNQNVYAGTILLLLALAFEKGDWLLAGGLLINLWWTRSVGAWLGLAVAIIVTRRRLPGSFSWAGTALALAAMVVIYNKFQSPDVLNRLEWWEAALAMIRDRPLTGYGPGTFAYVLPAYREGGGLATLYAHQYFLQTAAEYGLVFSIVWFSGLWSVVLRGSSYKRFGALAILVHSIWDWTLSMPANLWLFSYFAASSLTEESRGINIRSRYKLPAAVLLAAAGWLLLNQTLDLWAADRNKALARVELARGEADKARGHALAALAKVRDDHETRIILAEAERASAGDPSAGRTAAIAHMESAARLNPYRAKTWVDLSELHRAAGDADRARRTLARGADTCLRLRAHAHGSPPP